MKFYNFCPLAILALYEKTEKVILHQKPCKVVIKWEKSFNQGWIFFEAGLKIYLKKQKLSSILWNVNLALISNIYS